MILAFFVNKGKRYMQNAGAGWEREQVLWNQMYMIPEACHWKEPMSLLHCCSLHAHEDLAIHATANKDTVVAKKRRKDAQVVDRRSKISDFSQPAADHEAFEYAIKR